NRPTHVTIKKIYKQPQNPVENRLLIHTSYENRLRSIRKDIRQLWSRTFNNTNVIETKLIIGTSHRQNAKLELVRTCPHLSLITLPKNNTTINTNNPTT